MNKKTIHAGLHALILRAPDTSVRTPITPPGLECLMRTVDADDVVRAISKYVTPSEEDGNDYFLAFIEAGGTRKTFYWRSELSDTTQINSKAFREHISVNGTSVLRRTITEFLRGAKPSNTFMNAMSFSLDAFNNLNKARMKKAGRKPTKKEPDKK